MTKKINPAFKNNIINLQVQDIKYSKKIEPFLLKTRKFKVIWASIEEVGIIELPIVYENNNTYIVVDGHLRIEALKKMGINKIDCLVATDDESFTYNKNVNRISNIQEHKMIVKAIERGVSLEKIAKSLNLEPATLLKKKNLLVGICDEVIKIFKNKNVSDEIFNYMRKMHPIRQIEASNLMIECNNYTIKFVRAIYLGSSRDQLLIPASKSSSLDTKKFTKLDGEFYKLQKEYKLRKINYGDNSLQFTHIQGYLKLLFANNKVSQYLKNNFSSNIYEKFNEIVNLEVFEV